jgi:prophage antirepressor-like protein
LGISLVLGLGNKLHPVKELKSCFVCQYSNPRRKNMEVPILFEAQQIRCIWHNEEWFYVLSDVVLALTASKDVKQYIKRMRGRDKELSQQWEQIVLPLEVQTKGGKQKMGCANTQGIFRIIQSIP